jgi:sulfur dioxygenase
LKNKTLFPAILVFAALWQTACRKDMSVPTDTMETRHPLCLQPGVVIDITPQAVRDSLDSGAPVVIVDVREPGEFSGPSGHIRGALSIPLGQIEARVSELEPYGDRIVIAVCASGNRSRTAANFLATRGFCIMNMLGGMGAWNRLGFPIEAGSPKTGGSSS